jgi:hypothetical protein
MQSSYKSALPFGLTLLCGLSLVWPCGTGVPRLETQGSAVPLLVHDAPMLILAGELGNSSASSARYMAPHWPLSTGSLISIPLTTAAPDTV